jgi:hypothetical protein
MMRENSDDHLEGQEIRDNAVIFRVRQLDDDDDDDDQ